MVVWKGGGIFNGDIQKTKEKRLLLWIVHYFGID